MKKKLRITGSRVLFLGAIIAMIISIAISQSRNVQEMEYGTFVNGADQVGEFKTIGTNIRLHQVIYGNDGVQYRYKLESDCPDWAYEDRYLSKEPLELGDGPAAVETQASSLRIFLDGELLAQGQHFYVPLLKLYSNDEDYAAFKERLLKEAYSQYRDMSMARDGLRKKRWSVAFAIGLFLLMAAFLSWKIEARNRGRHAKSILPEGICGDEGLSHLAGITFLAHYIPEEGSLLVVAASKEDKDEVLEAVGNVLWGLPKKPDMEYVTMELFEIFYNRGLDACVVGEIFLEDLGITDAGACGLGLLDGPVAVDGTVRYDKRKDG